MPILTVRHLTSYLYRRPVTFGEHRMMLRPRDDDDQKVLESEFAITPAPSQIPGRGTFSAIMSRPPVSRSRASELHFECTIRLDQCRRPSAPPTSRVVPGLIHLPTPRKSCPILPVSWPLYIRIPRWIVGPPRSSAEDGSADTYQLLVDMTRTIEKTFKHVARHEKGVQEPARTLQCASGSCRDLAVFMISALRSLGIAARFVSGYLHLGDEDDDRVVGGNTHAWVQVYVPGPGWVDFDPSSGMVGNQNLVRVAVVHDPCEAIPLQGTWIGTASDHLAMKVAVKVTAATNVDA